MGDLQPDASRSVRAIVLGFMELEIDEEGVVSPPVDPFFGVIHPSATEADSLGQDGFDPD